MGKLALKRRNQESRGRRGEEIRYDLDGVQSKNTHLSPVKQCLKPKSRALFVVLVGNAPQYSKSVII